MGAGNDSWQLVTRSLPSWRLDSKELDGNKGGLGSTKEIRQGSQCSTENEERDRDRWPAEERAVESLLAEESHSDVASGGWSSQPVEMACGG